MVPRLASRGDFILALLFGLFVINISFNEQVAAQASLNQDSPIVDNNDLIDLENHAGDDFVEFNNNSNKIQTLHIAGLFPMTGTGGWIGGSGCLPAALMALDDVNARKDLLPGYKLELTYKDSQCNPGKAARFMYEMIYHPPKKVIMVCGCSTVCSIVAESANMWNLIVVGYGSSSPALSDRSRFPTFFRTHPSATIHNPTRIKLFEKYGWSRVAIILETEEVFIETARDLEQRCRARGIQLLTRVSFVRLPADAMDNLKRADPRIIVGMFYKQQARRVMCEAYKRGLFGEKYVWFLIGWYEDDWWTDTKDLDCTYEQMKLAVEGHITTEGLVLNQDNRRTISGYTSKDWLKRYQIELAKRGSPSASSSNSLAQTPSTTTAALLKSTSGPSIVSARPEGYQEAPLAYDAIWAIALALNSTIKDLTRLRLSVGQFNYTQTPRIRDVFLNNLRQTNFLGISGEVAFSDIGDRIAWTQIEQMVDGNYTVIGYYDYRANNLNLNESRVKWARGNEPPRDRTIIMELVQYLSLPYMLTVFVISISGIFASAGLIYFNWSYREDALIKMSHPPSNNIMLLGCIVCLISVILFGLDGRFIPAHRFHLICDLRAWCLNIGFSLFFGSMFWKVWQSYVLSTRSNIPHALGGMNNNLIGGKTTNNQVFMTVGSFCMIDVIILTIWKLNEPMDRTTVKIKEQSGLELNMGDDIIVELKIEYCQANFYWYYLIFCYKGLLLVFGLFLAYETRSVKLRQLNDSKLVGMCIYNVAILCFITGPVSLVNLMRQQANYHYLFVSITIIFCCSLSMILIFIPKVVEHHRRRKKRRGLQGGGSDSASGNNGQNQQMQSNSGGPNSNSNIIQEERSSRDDEEQLNKLEKEKRELSEKLREKESQVRAMIARIEEAYEKANEQQLKATASDSSSNLRQLQQQQPLQAITSLRGRRGNTNQG